MYPPYPNATQRQLETAEQSDSGRGLEFVYFDVSGGGQFVSLDAFSSSHWLFPPMSAVDTSSFGAYVSAAGGIRLLFLTLGPSFRFGTFTDWDLWTLNLDLGWHVPLGNLEPYAFIGGGFAKLARHHQDFPGATNTSITGFDVRLGGGVDYYVSNVFSVGAKLDAELLRLSRATTLDQAGLALAGEGSTLGLVVSTGAVAGLHF
jgi:hypothetical protein